VRESCEACGCGDGTQANGDLGYERRSESIKFVQMRA